MAVTINGTTGIETNTDTGKIKVGASDDLVIERKTDDHSYINNSSGRLRIQGDDVRIEKADGSEFMAKFTADGAAELYHNDTVRLATNANGVEVNGHVQLGDGEHVKLGAGTNGDLQIYHNSDNSWIQDKGEGRLLITSDGAGIDLHKGDATEYMARFKTDDCVELYHDGTKQCETSANGLAFPSGKGIDFSATGDSSGTTTSEILDEYEEGTWTGTIKYWDSSLGWHNAGFDTSPNNTTGLYTRVGRLVHVELYINGFDVNSTATGSYAAIAGLPFADATSDNHYGVISFAHDSCFATAAGGAYIEGSMIRPTNVGTTTSSTWKTGGPLYVMMSGTYEIN